MLTLVDGTSTELEQYTFELLSRRLQILEYAREQERNTILHDFSPSVTGSSKTFVMVNDKNAKAKLKYYKAMVAAAKLYADEVIHFIRSANCFNGMSNFVFHV
ncbi:hypothetical protein RND81_07G110300 [Saponaria officinalis]|uniref:Uncharacterized protein n=1 Tax=Saponaria officinalis TaxID=3572 RepID=A0AAW1JTV8_SAPOF